MEKIYKMLVMAMLLLATPSWAQSVVRGGNEWLQPVDFTLLSWDAVNATCPPPDNLCSGLLNSIDVTGYTWASQAEVDALLAGYGVPPVTASEAGSSWAPAVFADFLPTTTVPAVANRLFGLFSDAPFSPGNVETETIDDFFDVGTADNHLHQNFLTVAVSPSVGHWFYRASPPPMAVPTISVYGLVLTALGLIILTVRQRR